jgi:hypothetical protein
MLLWFIGGALAIVWNVFHDTSIDYRFVVAGVLLPDALDLVSRRLVAHSVVTAVIGLAIVMLGTWGRKPIRKKLVMLPFGMLLHLLLDGVFNRTKVFWWPVTGGSPAKARIVSLDRPTWLLIAMELAGAALIIWTWPTVMRTRESPADPLSGNAHP